MKNIVALLKKLLKYYDNLSFRNQVMIFIFIVLLIMMFTAPKVDGKNTNQTYYKKNTEIVATKTTNTPIEVLNSSDREIKSNYESIIEEVSKSDYSEKDLNEFMLFYAEIISVNSFVNNQYMQIMDDAQSIEVTNLTEEELISQINKAESELSTYRDEFKGIDLQIEDEIIKEQANKIIIEYYNSYGHLNNSLRILQEFIDTQEESLYNIIIDNLNNHNTAIESAESLLEEVKIIIENNTI